jgi:hypothetical protein
MTVSPVAKQVQIWRDWPGLLAEAPDEETLRGAIRGSG